MKTVNCSNQIFGSFGFISCEKHVSVIYTKQQQWRMNTIYYVYYFLSNVVSFKIVHFDCHNRYATSLPIFDWTFLDFVRRNFRNSKHQHTRTAHFTCFSIETHINIYSSPSMAVCAAYLLDFWVWRLFNIQRLYEFIRGLFAVYKEKNRFIWISVIINIQMRHTTYDQDVLLRSVFVVVVNAYHTASLSVYVSVSLPMRVRRQKQSIRALCLSSSISTGSNHYFSSQCIRNICCLL